MRDLINILNEANYVRRNKIDEEALWWLERWVSGSMRDPDWETDWIERVHDVDTAFAIIQRELGVSRYVGKPLWRALCLDAKSANKIVGEKILYPHAGHHGNFQSFTTSRENAIAIGEEFATGRQKVAIVSAIPAPNLVMFATIDALGKGALNGDWDHQNEVIVKVTSAIPLLTAEIIP